MDSSERAEPVKLLPQWMLSSGPSAVPNQRERENSWSRSRRSDSNTSVPDPSPKNGTSRYEPNGRAATLTGSENGNPQRRPADRFRHKTWLSSRTPRPELFDESFAGGSYGPKSNGPLKRSFSEDNARQQARPSRTDGGERESGKQRQRHHRSASTRDVTTDREGRPLGDGTRFGGVPPLGGTSDSGGSARHNREYHKEPGSNVKANFDKNFPTLGKPDTDRTSWSSHCSTGSQGRWTSRLAEQPSVEGSVDSIPPRWSPPPVPPPPPSRSPPPSQPARMADAVQQNPVDPEQNIIAEKQRLEMEQSRRLIPVIANPGVKAKSGPKGQNGGGRRGEHRDTHQRFNSMVTATKRMEDGQKHDSTLVLPKKSGSLSQRGVVLESTNTGMNGLTQHYPTSPAPDRAEIPPRGRRPRGESHDFTTHEKAKAQEREQNRLAFYNNLRRKSGHVSHGENTEPQSVVKRTVSEPSVFDPVLGEVFDKDGDNDKGEIEVVTVNGEAEVQSSEHSAIAHGKDVHAVDDGEMCGAKAEDFDDSHLWLPSAEEERFLVSLGWSANDEVTLLTDEEIAAWRKEKAHTPVSLKSRSGNQGFAPYACSAFHLNTMWHHSSTGYLVGSERTTSDSDSI